MSLDETSTPSVRDAVDALLQLNQHGDDLRPPEADPQAWAGSVLYDLARLSELLDGAVEKVSGQHNPAVAEHARALASVIAAHRNLAVGGAG